QRHGTRGLCSGDKGRVVVASQLSLKKLCLENENRGTRPRFRVDQRLNAFEDGSDALAQAHTHSGHAKRTTVLLHYVQQGTGDTGTGTTEGVSQGDRATVQVDLLVHLVEHFQVLQHRQGL